MAIQPNGAIVVVGTRRVGGDERLVAARLTPTGLPDPAFGVAGAVYLNWAGSDIYSAGILVQPDGKPVVVATVATSSAVEDDGDEIGDRTTAQQWAARSLVRWRAGAPAHPRRGIPRL